MSPEQAAGRLDLLGPTSDVYGLGATLYTLLTGRIPFVEKDLLEVYRKVEHGHFLRPRAVCPRLDRALEAVCLKAMALRPADRYDSPKPLADDIENWLADQRVSAWREPWSRRVGRWARRRRATFAYIISALVLLYSFLLFLSAAFFVFYATDFFKITDLGIRDIGRDFSRSHTEALEAAEKGTTSVDDRTQLRNRALVLLREELSDWQKMLDTGQASEVVKELEIWKTEADLAGIREEAALTKLPEGEREAFRAFWADVEALRIKAGGQIKTDLSTPRIHHNAAPRSNHDLEMAHADRRRQVQLKPSDAQARSLLGWALSDKGDFEGAIVEFREATRLKPDESNHHVGLGLSLENKGDIDAAVLAFREASRLRPGDAQGHVRIGRILSGKGDFEGAVAEFHEASRLHPDEPQYHIQLGHALRDKGDLDAAVVAFREASRLRPDEQDPLMNLVTTLRTKGDIAGAVAAAKEALRHNPDFAYAYCSLGISLGRQGLFREAVEKLERGHELGSKQQGWKNPSEKWVRDHRRLLELDQKLPAVLRGETRAADAGEWLAMADVCNRKDLRSASVRLSEKAFAERAELADDLTAGHRYNAACAAALAGSGAGKDDPPPDEPARAKLREQALGWLRADLAARGKVLEGGDANARQTLIKTLDHWKKDTDLAGIRNDAALAKLPEAEREAFRSLWADVEALRVKAGVGK
jgi:Flp pilus assembly protein TadD